MRIVYSPKKLFLCSVKLYQMMTLIKRVLVIITLLISLEVSAHQLPESKGERIDTTIVVDNVQVTAIKQGMSLRNKPIAASIIDRTTIERRGITGLKGMSDLVPNLYIPDYGSRMTSSIYVRGLGSRIDHPVMGLNVDNVPVVSKDNFDLEMADIERIEVLRGPQGTLYGRNTMGGVINVYTLSPLSYQGTRLGLEYGSGNSWKARASHYEKINSKLGVAASANFRSTDGFFTNAATNQKSDWERSGGGRFKIQWRGDDQLFIDNTLSFSILRQGGYAYAPIQTGVVNYNDPSTFDRTNLSYGLTVRKEYDRFSLSSITSYQYSDGDMTLDNDFTPESYFTLQQRTKEHSFTEDIVIKSNQDSKYQWLVGAFALFKHTKMDAPVLFKEDGINNLILANANAHTEYKYEWLDETLLLDSEFTTPNVGLALYHKSDYTMGRWNFSAAIRVDWEYSQLNYNNFTDTNYKATSSITHDEFVSHLVIDSGDKLNQSFVEVLPKISALYRVGDVGSLYASISKGYKAGGFNTQMFSDVLQQQLMEEMSGMTPQYKVEDIVMYKPEYSWNYEVGGDLWWREAGVKASFALYYIDCRDQQLTVFPEGQVTGRKMDNAGRTRSLGGEFSLGVQIVENMYFTTNYGYTNAKFVDYQFRKDINYEGNFVPYAPQHTFSSRINYTIPVDREYLDGIVLSAGARGVGRIYWSEENDVSQPFYALFDASIRFQTGAYSIDIWGRNLFDKDYDTFYFRSIGNSFTQKGKPRMFGITLNINL